MILSNSVDYLNDVKFSDDYYKNSGNGDYFH